MHYIIRNVMPITSLELTLHNIDDVITWAAIFREHSGVEVSGVRLVVMALA